MNFNKITENTSEPIYTYKNVKFLQDNYIPTDEAMRIKEDLEKEKNILDTDVYNYFDTIVKRSLALFTDTTYVTANNTMSSEPSIGTKIKNYVAVNESAQSIPGLQYPNEASGVINYQPNQGTFVQNHGLICEPEGILTKTDKFRELLKQMADIHDAKNAAYGDSFGQSIKNYGLIAALTRISDKFHRFENLVLHPEAGKGVTDESRKDTLLDMANYCIMTYLAMEDEK